MSNLKAEFQDLANHLNNAGASLKAHDSAYALAGMQSAIWVLAHCITILKHSSHDLNSFQRTSLRQMRDKAQELLDGYTEGYRMVERERPKSSLATGKNIAARRTYTDEEKLWAVIEAQKYPEGTPDRSKHFETIADKIGCAPTTIYGWLKELEGKPEDKPADGQLSFPWQK